MSTGSERFESRAIRPVVARTFALDEAAHALSHLVDGRPFGRVVLRLQG
jgi:NADPH:quinone reductase-like Zn-dependent oxidoreductase